jgi:uncharacterized protein (UPF0332 family)
VTPDQEALIDKARHDLRAAEMLLREGEPEIAASRGYYAMFHAAEAMLLNRGLSFSKHSGVMAAFGREFVRTGAVPSEFHHWLLDAFDARNIGDYEIHQRLTGEQAAEHVRRAGAFVDHVDRVLQAG